MSPSIEAALNGGESDDDRNGDGQTTVDELMATDAPAPIVERMAFATSAASGPSVTVENVSGLPGETVSFGVVVRTGGWDLGGMQNDTRFDPLMRVTSCRPNSALPHTLVYRIATPACDGTPYCVRGIYFDFDLEPDYELIPDGGRVYTCDLVIDASAPPGLYPLEISNFIFSTPFGSRIPDVVGVSGAVLVLEPSDCGNGALDAGEECDDGNTDYGDCCSALCEIETSATVCRPAQDYCDFAELCDGVTPLCDADATLPEGTACSGGSTYQCTIEAGCRSGHCQREAYSDNNRNGICDADDGATPIALSHLWFSQSRSDRANGALRAQGRFLSVDDLGFVAALAAGDGKVIAFDSDSSFKAVLPLSGCGSGRRGGVVCKTSSVRAAFTQDNEGVWGFTLKAQRLGTGVTGTRFGGANAVAPPATLYLRVGDTVVTGDLTDCSSIYNRILACRF